MKNDKNYWLILITPNPKPRESAEICNTDFYIYQGRKPSLKDIESVLDKLGYSSILSDIEEFPKERRKIINTYVYIRPIDLIKL